jgi:tetratricopeptide (TPR) repeat protein
MTQIVQNRKILENRYLHFALFLIIALIIYFKSFNYGYALDDIIVASENKFVKKGIQGISDIFKTESFTGYFGEQKNLVSGSRYRPLSIASFALEYHFFESKPKISHFINFILYILSVLILYIAVINIFKENNRKQWIAFFTCILFVVHPVHVEAVANIKGRDEIMCLLLCIISLYYFIKFIDFKKKWYLIASCIALFLGLLSKENALTFVIINPMTAYFFRSEKIIDLIKKSWLLALTGLIFIGIRVAVIGFLFDKNLVITDLMNDPFLEMNSVEKFCTILYTIVWYIKLLIVPYPLTHDYYPYHVPIIDLANPLFYVSFFVIGLLFFVVLKKWKSASVLSYSILFFFITMILVLNIFFPIGTFMNERFLFIPSISICLLAGYFLNTDNLNGKVIYSKIAQYAFILISSIFMWISYDRVPAWKDSDSLNFSAIQVSKNSARINLYMGVTYFNYYKIEAVDKKKYEFLSLAEKYIRKSVEIYPEYGQGLNMLAGVAAEWHKRDGDVPKLLSNFEWVISKQSNLSFVTEYITYLAGQAQNTSLLYNFYKKVGYDILSKQAKYEAALNYLGMAYKINGEDKDLLQKIGNSYLEYAKTRSHSPEKRQEFLRNGNSFLEKAKTLN